MDARGENADRRHPQTFRFSAEQGRRLRELRERAGLSLVELGHVMGRRPGYQTHLKRLEAGRLPYPSFALVADYLRACRASFSDLVPVLSGHTTQPPVRETRARETALAGLAGDHSLDAVRLAVYDRKTAEARRAAGQKPVLPGKRASALSRQLVAARERRALAAVVEAEVTRLGVNPTMVVRKVALDYARMVWRALDKTEGSQKAKAKTLNAKGGKKRGRPPRTREQRLEETRARMRELAPGILSDRALKQVEGKVVALYEDLLRVKKQ